MPISTPFVAAGIVLSVGGITGSYNAENIKYTYTASGNIPFVRVAPPANRSVYRSSFITNESSTWAVGSRSITTDFKSLIESLTTKSISLSSEEKRLISDNLFDLL